MARIWLINQYSTTPATGMGGRHHYLARELVKCGHEVTLIAASWHHLLREPNGCLAFPQAELVDGYKFYRVKMPAYSGAHSKARIRNWFMFAYKIRHLDRQLSGKPDVILYSSLSLIGYLGAERLAKRLGVRLVFEVRDIWPLTAIDGLGVSPKHPFIRLLQWVEDRAYRESDAIVSNLEGAIEHMVRRGADRSKYTWVSNGISLDEAENPEPISADIARKIPRTGLRIAYVGTLGHMNEMDTLIDALAEVKGACAVIVGDGPARSRLEQKVSDLELSNVVFTGAIPKRQVHSLMQQCDACWIGWKTSELYEFGISANKLFDYFFSGRPVLNSYTGKYDPVQRYNAGITVPAEDHKALAEAIRTLRDMALEKRVRMGANGKNAAREVYDYAKLALKLEKVLLPPAKRDSTSGFP